MKLRLLTLVGAMALALLVGISASAKSKDKSAPSTGATTTAPADPAAQENMRLEGEKRYHSNCGRCHMAPQKFPPRMMPTIIRHMRVRSTITDQDMRLILYYMTR